ncbi:hypothetical protein N7495_001275 [Penicillium taxi]|uniref:uncharacterized protein n=1 Tax=Penicillium taxi TaxID=168475 RepID=UPI002544F1C4|nr:uncharacterized protein N7495_001275 [Penicillium taxi]KAJ5908593.1 hypothetical protein N7495_001275 [Penicillium taxi]
MSDHSPDMKRKREASDEIGHDIHRMNRSSHGSNGSMTDNQNNFAHSLSSYDHGLPNTGSELNIDQQILQHVGPQNGMTDDNTLTAKAALAHNSQHKYPPPPDSGFDANMAPGINFGDEMAPPSMVGAHGPNSTAAAVYAAREAQSMAQKPQVGSPEWHLVRKNNHKEVERRRREAINEGINQIASLVPNCDKNKGAILQRCIEYIHQLQSDKKSTEERFEAHSLTANHAINDISASNSKLKGEVNRCNQLAAKWLQRCRDAGLEFDDYDDLEELKTYQTLD